MNENYLQTMVSESPQSNRQSAPVDTQPQPTPPSVQSASRGLSNAAGETVSPDFLAKLEGFMLAMDKRMTALEAVAGQSVSQQSATQGAIATRPQTVPRRRPVPSSEEYVTPVPTMHQPRAGESKRVWIEHLSVFGIAAALLGMLMVALNASPAEQTVNSNEALNSRVESDSHLIESLAEKASKSECRYFCF